MCTCLPGTTPDYWEDALTIPRLIAFREEWYKHPPVHKLKAMEMGYKPEEKGSIHDLLALLPNGKS